jgi:hypothetical protein
MRLSRPPALLVAGLLLSGVVSCSTTIDGTGTLAADVTTGAPAPSGTGEPTSEPTSDAPTPTPEPTTPDPTPTTNPIVVKQKLLCVLERGAISSVNSQFNKQADRAAQIRILRSGVNTIQGHINRSGLPASDGIRRSGTSVLAQLRRLVTDATGGNSPSTAPYNKATQNFQKACNSIS